MDSDTGRNIATMTVRKLATHLLYHWAVDGEVEIVRTFDVAHRGETVRK